MAPALERNERARTLPVVSNDGELPTELLSEVLLRLPANELCRLRLVCRSWRSLTSDPHFAKAHAARHRPLVAGFHFPSGEIRFMDLSGNVVKRIRVSDDCSCLHMSSQLDMVCISVTRVLNTATGAVTVLPGDVLVGHANVDRVGLACMLVLGHVPCTGELKVLRIHLRIDYDNNHSFRAFLDLTCDIMTLGNNGGDGGRWRVKPQPPYNVWSLNGDDAVVNGIAYFLIRSDRDFHGYSTHIEPGNIASFDLAAEEWRSAAIQGPPSIHLHGIYGDKIRLARLDGCLVTVLYNDLDCSVDLWFLVDVGSCIWTKRYSLQWSYRRLGHRHLSTPYPLVVLDDERVVVKDESALKAYDTRTRTWEHLTSIKGYLYVHKHEGSLLQSGSSELGPA